MGEYARTFGNVSEGNKVRKGIHVHVSAEIDINTILNQKGLKSDLDLCSISRRKKGGEGGGTNSANISDISTNFVLVELIKV